VNALSASSYVVLGLVEHFGPTTPYQLDRSVAGSVGYFWNFPRSQLYAEAGRLARRGLLTEHNEDSGRRRRLFTITAQGSAELHDWLTRPAARTTEIHDEGLLKLYLATPPTDEPTSIEASVWEHVSQVAREQIRAHTDQLEAYQRLVDSTALPDASPQRATLEFGLRFERLAIEFWNEISHHNPPAP
jgi:DNA-binding PadR family transcriptional regulator